MSAKNKPEILSYSNVNLFLNDFFKYKKSQQPGFSYQVWSLALKISEKSYLRQLTLGQRQISEENCLKFCTYFKFQNKEREHFEDLVSLSKMTGKKKDQLKEVIQGRVAYHQRKQLVRATKEFLQDTKVPLLLTLLSFHDLKKTPENLANILAIEPLHVQKYLATLEALGLAQCSTESEVQWHSTTHNFKVPDGFNNEFLILFHQKSMLQSLQNFKKNKISRRADCLLLPLTEQDYLEMTELLDKFLDSCTEKYQSDSIQNKKLYRFQTVLASEVEVN